MTCGIDSCQSSMFRVGSAEWPSRTVGDRPVSADTNRPFGRLAPPPRSSDLGAPRRPGSNRGRRQPSAGESTERRTRMTASGRRRGRRTASPARLGWRSPRGSPGTVRCRGALPGVSAGPSTSASDQHRTMSVHRGYGALTAGSTLPVGDWRARLRAGGRSGFQRRARAFQLERGGARQRQLRLLGFGWIHPDSPVTVG